jgi:hypothetical protein
MFASQMAEMMETTSTLSLDFTPCRNLEYETNSKHLCESPDIQTRTPFG